MCVACEEQGKTRQVWAIYSGDVAQFRRDVGVGAFIEVSGKIKAKPRRDGLKDAGGKTVFEPSYQISNYQVLEDFLDPDSEYDDDDFPGYYASFESDAPF